jgi:hydroxyethylthiazole kinase-like uncharacterized protein yjeF
MTMRKYTPSSNDFVMSREEVRKVDEWAIKTMGLPGAVLMENAGRSCAEFIEGRLQGVQSPLVCFFCGTGNNGGDGYVAARHLHNTQIATRVVVCGDTAKIKGDAKVNLDIIIRMGITVEKLDINARDIEINVNRLAGGASLIVDGLFGTGLQGRLADNYISLINGINFQDIPVVAIDIPSGLDCDSGKPLGAAIKALATITFVAAKNGFVNPAAAEYVGEIYVASIGIEPKR